VILRRICQLSLTRITHQVSRAFDLNHAGMIRIYTYNPHGSEIIQTLQ